MSESSLVQRTAELFRQASLPAIAAPNGLVRREPDPDHPQPGDPPIIRRFAPDELETQTATEGASSPSAGYNHIASLEQQVIEELERRGLRHDTGVF